MRSINRNVWVARLALLGIVLVLSVFGLAASDHGAMQWAGLILAVSLLLRIAVLSSAAAASPPDPDRGALHAVPAEVQITARDLLEAGKERLAVTLVRTRTPVPLRQARDIVAAIAAGRDIAVPVIGEPEPWAREDSPVRAAVAERVRAGDKIAGIRVLREATNIGLAAAKRYVDDLDRELRDEAPSGS